MEDRPAPAIVRASILAMAMAAFAQVALLLIIFVTLFLSRYLEDILRGEDSWQRILFYQFSDLKLLLLFTLLGLLHIGLSARSGWRIARRPQIRPESLPRACLSSISANSLLSTLLFLVSLLLMEGGADGSETIMLFIALWLGVFLLTMVPGLPAALAAGHLLRRWHRLRKH